MKLVNTPITYAGLPAEFYPGVDWFSTVKQLQKEISRIDFDIALLSCGSYAMPLGVHVARQLERKAIYVGGVLQLYFGIMGEGTTIRSLWIKSTRTSLSTRWSASATENSYLSMTTQLEKLLRRIFDGHFDLCCLCGDRASYAPDRR